MKLPSPKHTRSHSQSRKDDYQKGNKEKRDTWLDKTDQTDESNNAVSVCPKSVISYKEYKAQKEIEQGASTADKSTPEEEEDWDAEPSLPPRETPPGASSMAPSQEDEWKQMIDQDPWFGRVCRQCTHWAGEVGHRK